MIKRIRTILILSAFLLSVAHSTSPDTTRAYLVERESTIAKKGTGPHRGNGEATAYMFFKDVTDLHVSFQKHILHVGSEVGYHKQVRDKIYYIVSGKGRMTVNGVSFEVYPGDAILTRKGNFHGMLQLGDEDLVFIVTYPKD